MTIQEAAKIAFDSLERKSVHRENQEPRTIYVQKDDAPEWVNDLIREAHDGGFPDDECYERIADVLLTFKNMDEDADPSDEIAEMEPDVYTKDLTAWLANEVGNVEYLNQAISEYEPKNGFNALQIAQKLYIEEIANNVLGSLQEFAKYAPDEDSDTEEETEDQEGD